MADQDSRDQSRSPGGGKKPNWIARGFGAVERYFEKRRAEKKQQNPADRAARSTARATWFIALLTIATIGVGISQFRIYEGQLNEMRAAREGSDKSFAAQLAVMQAQTRAMQGQAQAMQGQLDQMTADQRPWLAVSDLRFNDIVVYPVGAGILIDTSYKVTNLGRSPATDVFIKTALIFSERENFNGRLTRDLCNEHPSTDERLLATYSETVLPTQVLFLESGPMLKIDLAATFSHRIEDLENAGVSSIAADFFLVGCITYKALRSGAFHHTGFAYKAQDLDIKLPGFPFTRVPFEKGIVKDNLIVMPSPYGNFADW